VSGYSTAAQLACLPGPRSAAAVMTPNAHGLPVLVVFLDPINLTIQCPKQWTSVRSVAAFCRELSREASVFADMLDPAGASGLESLGQPRHALREPADGEGAADV
jgi:hypothetical protein